MDYTKRIKKPFARKIYNAGYTIALVPCNCGAYNEVARAEINKATSEELVNQFDRAVNEFEYYNCNSVLGMYPHFYTREADYIAVFGEE